jgi:hypothetical protein
MSETALATQSKPNNIADLGDGQVFIRALRDGGAIKAVRGVMTLREREGQLADIQGKVMITAAGYNEMNKIAGVSVLTPDFLSLPDGRAVPNPFPIIDPATQSISKVWVKKLAVGYSPTGNLVITSSSLLYDIQMYFVQDLVKKVKANRAAGRICMKSSVTDDEFKHGAFYAIEGGVGVWADMENIEVIKCVETFVQNKLFAERKAQTVAERNVLKKQPALSQVYVEPTGAQGARQARVTVYGFTSDLTKEDLLKIAAQASADRPVEFDGHMIEVLDAGSQVTEEDLGAAHDEEEGSDESAGDQGAGEERRLF